MNELPEKNLICGAFEHSLHADRQSAQRYGGILNQ